MTKYTVRVKATLLVYTSVEVEANSPEAAEIQVKEKTTDNFFSLLLSSSKTGDKFRKTLEFEIDRLYVEELPNKREQ